MTSLPGPTAHVDGSHRAMCTAQSGRQRPRLTGASARDSRHLNPMPRHGKIGATNTWLPYGAASSTDAATVPRLASSRGKPAFPILQPPRHARPASMWLSGAPMGKLCTNARSAGTSGPFATFESDRAPITVQVMRCASARRNSRSWLGPGAVLPPITKRAVLTNDGSVILATAEPAASICINVSETKSHHCSTAIGRQATAGMRRKPPCDIHST